MTCAPWQMADAEYDAKVMRFVYRYVPYVGAFMLVSQLLGPVVSYVRFKSGTMVEATFVSRVRFASGSSSSRGIGQSSCAYNYRVQDKEHYLIQDCSLLPGFAPQPGNKYLIVFHRENPPLIISQVSFAPGWLRLFTAVIGLALTILPRIILPRLKGFKP